MDFREDPTARGPLRARGAADPLVRVLALAGYLPPDDLLTDAMPGALPLPSPRSRAVFARLDLPNYPPPAPRGLVPTDLPPCIEMVAALPGEVL